MELIRLDTKKELVGVEGWAGTLEWTSCKTRLSWSLYDYKHNKIYCLKKLKNKPKGKKKELVT